MRGCLYFRSDTRTPEEIFRMGFSSTFESLFKERIRDDNTKPEWWLEAIKSRAFSGKCGIDIKSSDADGSCCVCMTRRLESAALFPLGDIETTYIYVIALPESTAVRYKDDSDEVEIIKDEDTLYDTCNMVLDLHSLQAQQTANIFSFFNQYETKNIDNLAVCAGWTLHAHEAITRKVFPSSIIGAIQCDRASIRKEFIACDEVYDKPQESLRRNFTLIGDIIENEDFSCASIVETYTKTGETKLSVLDYTPLKAMAIERINQLREKPLEVPSIYSGLGGKTF